MGVVFLERGEAGVKAALASLQFFWWKIMFHYAFIKPLRLDSASSQLFDFIQDKPSELKTFLIGLKERAIFH